MATEDNVEHIFKDIGSGNYKIVVTNEAGGKGTTQKYGIAWWFGNGGSNLSGDYNGDGHVDAADYVVWRNDPGTFGGGGGYNTWRANFGTSAGSGASATAVPETMSITLLATALVAASAARRTHPYSVVA
jgi:hypothetical protein